MAVRLVLDENVEHEVGHRLEDDGHDVVHVDFVSALGKGTDDDRLSAYSIETDRVIVPYADDFVVERSEDEYRAALSVSDVTLSVEQVAAIVHAVSLEYPQAERRGLEYVGREWL